MKNSNPNFPCLIIIISRKKIRETIIIYCIQLLKEYNSPLTSFRS